MRIHRRRFLALTGLASLATIPACRKTDSTIRVEQNTPLDPSVGSIINSFAVDIFRNLGGQKGNLFFSPFSISTALGMTAAGAHGATLEQIQKVLQLPEDSQVADARYRGLMAALAPKNEAFELSTANAIWAQSGFPWRPEFKTRIAQFGAGLRDADFRKKPEAGRKEVNAWVEAQTQHRIRDLFAPGTISPDTRMVLANAIVFKGFWTKAFEKRRTRPEPFLCADGQKMDVPMMGTTEDYRLYSNDQIQMLTLPYRGHDLAMQIILPVKPDGLPAVEKMLTAELIAKWQKESKPETDVNVEIPKFKLASEIRLNDTLIAMGMSHAFDETKADFSGMHTGEEKLYISLVIHKALVDVNEEGTEAAASTAVEVKKSEPLEPRQFKFFRADHPFLLLIRHQPSDAILFLGRYAEPSN